MAELWQLPATHLAALVRNREVSAREAVQAAFDRLTDVNGAINAVVEYRPEEALAAADGIDARLRNKERVGALAGVPVTVKVNVDQAGYATTEGVRLQSDLFATTNNPVVDNLLKAGAVIIGRQTRRRFPCGGSPPIDCTAKHATLGTIASRPGGRRAGPRLR